LTKTKKKDFMSFVSDMFMACKHLESIDLDGYHNLLNSIHLHELLHFLSQLALKLPPLEPPLPGLQTPSNHWTQ